MKVALLGCGYLGSRHGRKLALRSDIDSIVLFDVVRERAEALASELNAAGARTSVVASTEEAIRSVEAAVIAASTEAHCDLALQCLEAGRHVLVEKPIAATLAEADRMIAAARASGRVLQVGHVERFNPVVTKLAGRIKAPRFIEVHRLAAFQPRSLDIDVILDLMIHDIDLVLHFTRELPSSIEAAGTSVLTGRVDIANARLAFPGRCVANLTASRVSLNRTRKIRFFMPETYVSVDLGEKRAEKYTLKPGPALASGAGGAAGAAADPMALLDRISHEPITGEGDALEAEQAAFFDAVRGTAPVQVPGEDGRAALAVALRILSRLREQES